jgi:hypothetical protein
MLPADSPSLRPPATTIRTAELGGASAGVAAIPTRRVRVVSEIEYETLKNRGILCEVPRVADGPTLDATSSSDTSYRNAFPLSS